MKAILLASFALALSFPTARAQQDPKQEAVLAVEGQFWTAYAAGDTEALGRLLLPDFTSVEQEIWNRQQVLAFVGQFHSMCSLVPVKIGSTGQLYRARYGDPCLSRD